MRLMLHKTSKCERVTKNILDDIERGLYTHGELLPTANEMSTRYNVSEITVKRAMSHLAEAKILKRIPGKGTFVSENAKNMKRQIKIGILPYVPGVVDRPGYVPEDGVRRVFNSFYEPAEDYLHERMLDVNYLPTAVYSNGNLLRQKTSELSGLIVSCSYIDKKFSEQLQRLEMPLVVVQHLVRLDEPFCQVIPDFSSALDRVAEQLSKAGRTIVMLTREGIRDKEKLCMDALANAGVPAEKIVIKDPQGSTCCDMGQLDGYRLGREIIAELEDPVILSTSDFLSFGLLAAFKDEGIKLGKIPLISIDDLEGDGIVPFERPLLTSIRVPRRRISHCAAELLMDLTEKPRSDFSTVIRLKTELVVRESSGDLFS